MSEAPEPGVAGAPEPRVAGAPEPRVEVPEPRVAEVPEPRVEVPEPRVAEVLQELRSGVRQRLAEVATIGGAAGGSGGGGGEMARALLAVRSHEYVEEPVAFSHRPRFGRVIVFARKAFFHLFLKWWARPLLAQQNAFNQAAARMLQELAEAEERTARAGRLLAARLAELEARQPRAAAPPPEQPG